MPRQTVKGGWEVVTKAVGFGVRWIRFEFWFCCGMLGKSQVPLAL